MKNMRPTDQILNEIFRERNSSINTQKSYARSVNQFELYFQQHLGEILIIAETEEDQGIPWRKSTLRQYLIEFRSYLYEKYKSKTAKLYEANKMQKFTSTGMQIGSIILMILALIL